jgi:hypothetical protein
MPEILRHIIVSTLRRLRGHIHPGVYANLRCGCGAKQVGPIHMSRKRPTFGDCLREFGQRIERDHDPTCVATVQKFQTAEKDVADASTKRPADEGLPRSTQMRC